MEYLDGKVEIPLGYFQSLEQSSTVLCVLLSYIDKCVQRSKKLYGVEESELTTISIDLDVVEAIQEGLI